MYILSFSFLERKKKYETKHVILLSPLKRANWLFLKILKIANRKNKSLQNNLRWT